jgi:ParB/RepB/Spo0J family partition protein
MSARFGKASKQRLTLASVPRESGAADRLLDNSRQMVRLDSIDGNPRNPRTHVDEASLRELAASIAEHGLLQAPVVRRNPESPDRYVVVLGSRRVAAHRLLGREEIEVIVRRLDDRRAFLASCVENVQRVELSPREEMDMIGVLIDELGSQEAAARALGKSPAWLSKRKRVLGAPALAAAVERGEISLDHAYDVLARSPDERTAAAHLERVRAGVQNQGGTRDALRPRQRRSPDGASPVGVANVREEPISDRNREPADPAHSQLAALPDVYSEGGRDGQDRDDRISDRNRRPISEVGGQPGADSGLAVRVEQVAETRLGLISDRNRSTTERRQPADDRTDMVELGALATLRLARERGERVPRHEVVRALREDLEALEKE